jgi:hypothetical protein
MSSAKTTTNHDEIRKWAEERNAKPSTVKRTGKKEEPGVLRLDFPGYSGGDSLQEISWDEWFSKFDEEGLALLYQAETKGGEKSNFNKLVSRFGADYEQVASPRAKSSANKSQSRNPKASKARKPASR